MVLPFFISLPLDNYKNLCILFDINPNKPMNLPGIVVRTGRGGLSGEHIQLCAEGARRKPNLSGKWTEMA